MTQIPPDVLATWQRRLTELRENPVAKDALAALVAGRQAVIPDARALVERYTSGKISLTELKETFDRKTRKEWGSLGAAGQNGAMVLNQIALRSVEAPPLAAAWREVVVVPKDPKAATGALERFVAVLDEARLRSPEPGKFPQSSRIPILASVLWSVQSPDEWPPLYKSTRAALAKDGLCDPDDYADFRAAFSGLRDALGIGSWELEWLLGAHAPQDGSEEAPGAAAPRIWLIAPGPKADQWDSWWDEGIMGIGWNELGDLAKFESHAAVLTALRTRLGDRPDPTNAARACWQFAAEMRPGDLVYAKRGIHMIVGYGEITSDYRFEPKQHHAHVRRVKWHGRGEWEVKEKALAMKTLTEIGKYPALVREIRALIGGTPDEQQSSEAAAGDDASAPYGIEDAAKELFLSADRLEEIVALCRYKKNIILQGPPGVGKTFVASRLAHLLIGSTNEEQVCRVQFHPSYAYEDFVQGLRPTEAGGFERQDGPLLRFCKDALEDQDSPYVLIIDEINRGNVSKILGELLSLFEADKRSPRYGVTLAYARAGEARFHVPPNVYVIGMMNTADRALALVDYALRRRFLFVDLAPAFGTRELEALLVARGVEGSLRARINARLSSLNEVISNDASLGRGYEVGHSYFCQAAELYDEAWFDRVLRYEIEPLLREYWFDDAIKLATAIATLRGS